MMIIKTMSDNAILMAKSRSKSNGGTGNTRTTMMPNNAKVKNKSLCLKSLENGLSGSGVGIKGDVPAPI